MTQLREAAQILVDALHLEQPPIAVSLAEAPPDGVAEHERAVPAGCVFWQQAAHGSFTTSPADHAGCTVGMHTHGMAPQNDMQAEDLKVSLKVFNDLGYVREEDLARIPTLPAGTRHVVYAPLSDAPLPPDAVLLFTDARQGLIVTEAAQQVEGGMPPALGRPACAVVPQTINTGRAALSLGCCGARAYLDALPDSLALWALPGARIAEYAERIQILASANQTLTKFHKLRRQDVEAGGGPTISESLARLQASS